MTVIVYHTAERAANFRAAVTALQNAIDHEAPRAILDKLQADVCRYRCKGLGDNMIEMDTSEEVDHGRVHPDHFDYI